MQTPPLMLLYIFRDFPCKYIQEIRREISFLFLLLYSSWMIDENFSCLVFVFALLLSRMRAFYSCQILYFPLAVNFCMHATKTKLSNTYFTSIFFYNIKLSSKIMLCATYITNLFKKKGSWSSSFILENILMYNMKNATNLIWLTLKKQNHAIRRPYILM